MIGKLGFFTGLVLMSATGSWANAAQFKLDNESSANVQTGGLVQNESQAKTELKRVLAKTNSFEARFNQTIIDSQEQVLQKAEGTIILAKPNKMKWQTIFPDDTLLVADGENVFNMDPAVEQLTIFSQASIANNNPLMLLVSDDEHQWASVTVTKTSVKHQYAVLSNDVESTISSVVLTFSNDVLTKLVSVDTQNQSNVLEFSKVKLNADVPNSVFVVTAPDYFIVDDQRQGN